MVSKALVNRETGEIIERPENQPAPLVITPEYVEQQKRSIALLQNMAVSVLTENRDYGHIPGTQGKSLFDPGASLIIGAFNCHIGQRRLLRIVDDGNTITVVVEVPLMSFNSDREVGSGIGAASTQEVKYKYRWEENPKDFGYDDESMKSLKKKTTDGVTKYRIPNPEHGELLNTIVKIASKRAEVDAAEGLPGVGSALRELFGGMARRQPDWAGFWSRAKAIGLSEERVYAILGVTSMKQWTESGRTLDNAIKVLADNLLATKKPPADTARAPETKGTPTPDAAAEAYFTPPEPGTESESKTKSQRDPATLKTINDLYRACNQDFIVSREDGKTGPMQPADVLKELGVDTQSDIAESPADCYRRIASVR